MRTGDLSTYPVPDTRIDDDVMRLWAKIIREDPRWGLPARNLQDKPEQLLSETGFDTSSPVLAGEYHNPMIRDLAALVEEQVHRRGLSETRRAYPALIGRVVVKYPKGPMNDL